MLEWFNSVPGHHHSKELSGVASCPPSPLSVRYFSARSGSLPGYDDGEALKLELPLAQSAFSPLLSAAWLENRSRHLPLPQPAIVADTVGINTAGSTSE